MSRTTQNIKNIHLEYKMLYKKFKIALNLHEVQEDNEGTKKSANIQN